MISIVLYGILIAHLNAYKEYYIKIGLTFATTFITKRLVKGIGGKEHSDIVGLGGYALTASEFAKLLQAIKSASHSTTQSDEAKKIIGGFLGDGLDILNQLMNKK